MPLDPRAEVDEAGEVPDAVLEEPVEEAEDAPPGLVVPTRVVAAEKADDRLVEPALAFEETVEDADDAVLDEAPPPEEDASRP